MTRWDWVFAGLCVAWLAALAKVGGAPWPVPRDLPAWVQAVGSIAAILAVFVIQRRDHAFNAKQNAQDAADRSTAEAEGVNLLIAEANVVVEGCVSRSQNRAWTGATAAYALAQLEANIRMFETIDFKILPGRLSVAAFFRSRQALIASRRQVEMIIGGLPVQPTSTFFDPPRDILREQLEIIAHYVPERR